jgi:hypothetical protein
MRGIAGVLGLTVLLAGKVFAAGSQDARPPTEDELRAVTERGRMLYEYDQAAWHASDAVQTANPRTTEGQLSIARKLNDKWMVVFGKLQEDRSRFAITYEADEQASLRQFAIKKEPEERQDEGFFLHAARAIELAMHDFGKTGRPYDVAVLPAPAEQLYVYLYPTQIVARVYPLGGDVRYLVSADGMTILEKRQMHNTILEKAPTSRGQGKAGYHTHALGEVPEDTDVFHVLTEEPPAPEFIATPHFLYQVKTDGTIQLEKEKKRRKQSS